MKKLLKWLGGAAFVLALALGALALYASKALPKVAPADQALKIELTSARVARGKYLAHHVNDCLSCHSQRDWSVFGGPLVAGSEFMGGEPVFDERIGLPGKIPPKNLTPYNLKKYSDGELVRAIRVGVRANGDVLFPMMPFQHYAQMTQEDVYSVIAYLRTLKEHPNDVPEHEIAFPVNLIIRTIPKDAGPYPAPLDPKNTVEHGKYMVNAAACMECHTPVDKQHNPIADKFMAGGQEFPMLNIEGDMSPLPGGFVRTANLTPDDETGIGKWSKEAFIGRFKDWRGKKGEAQMVKLKNGEFQTVMPWGFYAGMTDSDLGAIYDYLKTLKPVKNSVVKFTAPKI